MAVSHGYSIYTDDRDQKITQPVKDGAKPPSNWHERQRIDANGVMTEYLFSEKNDKEFMELMQRHDKEFTAWFYSGETGAK